MSDDPGGPALYLVAALCYLLCVVYAVCTSYFHCLNEGRLKKEAENGSARAKKLLRISEKKGEAVCQFGMIFWGIVGVSSIAVARVPALLRLSSTLLAALSAAGLILLSAFSFFIFGDLLPKKITALRAAGFTYRSTAFFRFFYLLIRPLPALAHACSDLLLRIFGLDPRGLSETVTEEEIMLMVGQGERRGVIQETEKDMIENILDFNDTTASEVMTHRTDICAAEDTDTIEEVLALAVDEGRSRIPVYHEDIDSIQGILYVKDLLPYIGKPIPDLFKLTDIIRPAYFIPESKKCSQLFSELTERKLHIAIIVDEYGGTSGLITVEDLIESIVGSIQDEYDNEEEEILRLGEDEFTVDGATPIDEISDLVGIDLPEGDYDTIAGYVTELLGKILKEDEHPMLMADGLEIQVLQVSDQRIAKLRIKKIPRPDSEEDD